MKLIFLPCLFSSLFSFAQPGGGVLNPSYPTHVYPKSTTFARKAVPYTSLREKDVMWSRKVWRVLDMREKMNHPLYYPTERIANRRSMIQVIRDAVESETITAYSSLDEEFRMPLSSAEFFSIGTKTDTLWVENIDGDIVATPIESPFESSTIKRYRIMEEYFFDNQRSVIDVRIIGICPVRELFDENDEYRGDSPMCWIYFPEIRPVFATVEVYNRQNNAERRSLDDIFWKRWFSSHIYKESNVYDRQISEYKTGLDALLEGKRISEEIRDFEQDLWEY